MDIIGIILLVSLTGLVYQGMNLMGEGSRGFRFPLAGPKGGGREARARKRFSPAGTGPARGGSKGGFNAWLLQNKRLREPLELLLLRSGRLFGWTAQDVLFYKEIGAGLAVLALWYFDVPDALAYLAGAAAGFWLPDLFLRMKIAERKGAISRQLPGFVDLLALTLESGLDLLAAAERILEKMKPNPLKEEVSVLLQESVLGTPRREALRHLSFRVNLNELQSLTSIIIQSEELGTSLAAVLRNYAEDMRSRRILLAEETAGKAPVKLLFPMMVFFFPIVFVIIFGPLALSVVTSYK